MPLDLLILALLPSSSPISLANPLKVLHIPSVAIRNFSSNFPSSIPNPSRRFQDSTGTPLTRRGPRTGNGNCLGHISYACRWHWRLLRAEPEPELEPEPQPEPELTSAPVAIRVRLLGRALISGILKRILRLLPKRAEEEEHRKEEEEEAEMWTWTWAIHRWLVARGCGSSCALSWLIRWHFLYFSQMRPFCDSPCRLFVAFPFIFTGLRLLLRLRLRLRLRFGWCQEMKFLISFVCCHCRRCPDASLSFRIVSN